MLTMRKVYASHGCAGAGGSSSGSASTKKKPISSNATLAGKKSISSNIPTVTKRRNAISSNAI